MSDNPVTVEIPKDDSLSLTLRDDTESSSLNLASESARSIIYDLSIF